MPYKLKNGFVFKVGIVIDSLIIYAKCIIEYLIFRILDKIKVNLKETNSNQILCINSEKLGDVILTTDFINSIIESKKYDCVCYLVRAEYIDIINDTFPNIEVIPCKLSEFKVDFKYKIELLKKLQARHFTDVINISPVRGIINDELTILAKGKNTIATLKSSQYMPGFIVKKLNHRFNYLLEPSSSNIYAVLMDALNLLKISLVSKSLLKTNYSELDFPYSDFIAVAPLASLKFRSWPLNYYKVLCHKLSKKYKILLLGTEEQAPELEEIADSNQDIINTAGKYHSFELPSIIKKSKLFIGNDSGLTHIALQLNKSFIGIIGGGKHGLVFPYKPNNKSIYEYHLMECFNCNWMCKYKEPYCITEISAEKVYDDALKLLEAK